MERHFSGVIHPDHPPKPPRCRLPANHAPKEGIQPNFRLARYSGAIGKWNALVLDDFSSMCITSAWSSAGAARI